MKHDLIVKMLFGSHLYGTNTSHSDMDYKGVFMPTKEQIFLGNIPKSSSDTLKRKKKEGEKNTSDDIDTEIYSLHYFIQLACEGQTVALDMLHAPKDMLINSSNIWNDIVRNKERFYTKNLKAFVGYARKQAAKYGVKGSRLDAVKQTLDFLKQYSSSDLVLKSVWNDLPVVDHCYHIKANKNGINQYQICGKILQDTMKVDYAMSILQKYLVNYGARAKLAAQNEGIDWKAISHALRAAYQVKQLLIENTITFPLKEASYLSEVKQGKLNYLNEVAPKLEKLMDEVEELAKKSSLPEKVNRKFWDNFIIAKIEECL